MHSDNIEFPHAACHDSTPHPAHQIIGTWRSQCPGLEGDQTTSDGVAINEWIARQTAELNESELRVVMGVLNDIAAGRPVEHFAPGTEVYCESWGDIVFIVQGETPWYEDGVVSRKIAISTTDDISGHVDPQKLRRVRPELAS